jgi:hypothetical protein
MTTTPAEAPTMQRRSWYLDTKTADAFAEVIEELHFTTRRPKHEVLATVIAFALEHQADIHARLTGEDPSA